MTRPAAALLVALALMASSASAQDETQVYFNGRLYMSMAPDLRAIYVAGLMDELSGLTGAVVPEARTDLIRRAQRCFAGKSKEQLRDIVDAYVRSDPAFLHYTMPSNFGAMIHTRCPG